MIYAANSVVWQVATDYDVSGGFALIRVILEPVYFVWLLFALRTTQLKLDDMSQARLIRRFSRLRCLLVFAFAFSWFFGSGYEIDRWLYDEPFEYRKEAVLEEVKYFVVLLGVAILWRPSATSSDYFPLNTSEDIVEREEFSDEFELTPSYASSLAWSSGIAPGNNNQEESNMLRGTFVMEDDAVELTSNAQTTLVPAAEEVVVTRSSIPVSLD